MVLDYVLTVWDTAEPKTFNAEIYTDWANHYLEKARNKRFITDLQQDITDGVLLADVIEAVTNEKVKDIKTKPKNSAQMVENINICLTFLASIGVNVEGLTAKDIKDGNLKAILGLFFSLSRFKQQQKSQQQKQEQKVHRVEASPDNHNIPAGKNLPQINGGEMLSKLPAPFKQGSRCPTITNPSTKESTSSRNLNSSQIKSPNSTAAVNEKSCRLQQNIQNNNSPGSSVTSKNNTNNNNNNLTPSRAISPSSGGSGIPTPGGRGLTSTRSQSHGDKSSGRLTNIPVTASGGPATPVRVQSLKSSPTNKNSMLDKFKFFNSKDKNKTKNTVVKSASKTSTNSALSSSSRSDTDSRSDTKSSASARSSSSTDPGASTSTSTDTTDSGCPKTPVKSKSFARSVSGKKETQNSLTVEHNAKKIASSTSSQARTPSPNTTTSTSGKKFGKLQKSDSKLGHASPPHTKKSSKIGSFIPKTQAKSSKSSSSNSLSSQANSSSQSSSIPKLSSKSTKTSKEEKKKYSTSSKEKSSLSSASSSLAQKSSNASFRTSPHHSQLLHQHQTSRVRSAPQTPVSAETIVIRAQDSLGYSSLGRQGRADVKMHQQSKTHYTEIEFADGRIERIGDGHYSKPSHLALPTIRLISTTAAGQNFPQNSHYSSINKGNSGSIDGYMVSSSHAVNVVKPTCTVASSSKMKADGNTQTTLSVLQQTASIQNTPLPNPPVNGQSSPSISCASTPGQLSDSSVSHSVTSGTVSTTGQNSDSTPSSASHSGKSGSGNSGSSSESVIFKPSSCDELSGSEKNLSSGTSSPKLGISQGLHNRPANNVAIVQPRSGEKVETTFDTEVRTEKIIKPDANIKISRQTTFSEKQTTFVDDSGEALDIKPMAPITRSMPYGYLCGYAGAPAKNLHLVGGSVTPTSAYYATSASGRLGMSRPLIDHRKYGYSTSGAIKRTLSQGQSNPMDTDYSSDCDTYDYISGYMSDGDILKSTRTDDMCSGYLSEGGASLYARRLQQRFREGMQAVKECMQKSSGLIDDDSFDDSSSISSGEISDTIAEISTDEGNLTGGSSQSETNPYSSIKRTPKDLINGSLQVPIHTKRVPNLGTSAFLGTDYSSDNGHLSGWKKYTLPQTNRLLSSDPADYAYLYNGYDQMQWRKHEQAGLAALQKFSNASQPEIYYGGRGSDVEGVKSSYSANGSPCKRDCETNTDQSHLMEASMKTVQSARVVGVLPAGHGYGYHRPLSNLSTSSAGSNKSNGSGKHSNVGSRLAKHGVDNTGELKSNQELPTTSEQRKTGRSHSTDMGPEAYSCVTLESKRKGLSSSKSVSGQTSDSEIYRSNTLGRHAGRMFGSRTSLTKTSQGENVNGSMFCGTIISNPHATFGKADNSAKLGYNGVPQPQQQSPQSGAHSPYMMLEYSSPRNSGASTNGQWLKASNGNHNGIGMHTQLHMSETESMESLSSQASSIQAQIQQARALSGASARILAHQRDSAGDMVGLHRSDSVKSTQSECLYQNTQHCLAEDLVHTNSFSQLPSPPPPLSPTPSNNSHSSRFTYPMAVYASPALLSNSLTQNMVRSNTQSSLPYGSPAVSKINKDEDSSLHGSNLSLVSSSSSVFSTSEEKQVHEIQKLRRELSNAQDKVSTLTTQLSTNAHVVAAFEQSLSNMTVRLQTLTATAEQKTYRCSQDSELNELRETIESLKSQSGLGQDPSLISPHVGRRHTSPSMVNDLSNPPHLTPQGPRLFHTLPIPTEARITRQMSSDSMSSINSLSSAYSMTSQQSSAMDGDLGKKKKKGRGWLRSSFSKAFSRKKNKHGSMSDVEPDTASIRSNISAPNSPLLQLHMPNGPGSIKGSHSSGFLLETEDVSSVVDLKKQLRDKDAKLTDIRLEALSSAHQLEQLRESMNKMKNEMSNLKNDNDRLQRMMCRTNKTVCSPSSLLHTTRTSTDSIERSLTLTEQTSLDMLLAETPEREGKRVTIAVHLGSNPDPMRLSGSMIKNAEILIGSLSVSGKTKWDILDNIVRKIFKEYVLRIDPVTNLGLSTESVFAYHIGEIIRTKESEVPELLPIGYLVGDTMQIGVCVKGTKQNSVDSMAFETLIPKSIIQRYVSLLMEHRRIILCGPSGTGKTYLAQKLAEHLVLRSGKELTAGAVATFNVDHKSAKDLRQYLTNIADQCENTSAGELPSVIILDNLHHVSSLGEVFNGFLSCKYQKCPYIIGTMNQATCSTTNLQLHHNFRWVLCANHMEPVKGFLGRYLRRKLVEAEVHTGMRNNDLNRIIDWIPKIWLHLNKFLETHSSSDVTIGPRLFLSCPMDISGSQVWFIDLWNYSIVPYMIEAVREGLQVYGRRANWEDPTEWVLESFPWVMHKEEEPSLLRIRPEDVGFDTQGIITTDSSSPKSISKSGKCLEGDTDPLMNMIMRLQEAANCTPSNDSDSTSIDSHSSCSVQDYSATSSEPTL